jgi:hypothetical protein
MSIPKGFEPPDLDPEVLADVQGGREELLEAVRRIAANQEQTNKLLKEILAVLIAGNDDGEKRRYPRVLT